MGEIGERESLGFQFVARDPAGKGHRLEADAADALDVFERQPDDVANLVIVHSLHDGGHEHDLQPGLLHVFNALQLLLPQRLAPRAAIDVVAYAVELEVERMESRFLALLREFQAREFDPVGGRLQVREAHLPGHPQDVQKTGIDGRFAA